MRTQSSAHPRRPSNHHIHARLVRWFRWPRRIQGTVYTLHKHTHCAAKERRRTPTQRNTTNQAHTRAGRTRAITRSLFSITPSPHLPFLLPSINCTKLSFFSRNPFSSSPLLSLSLFQKYLHTKLVAASLDSPNNHNNKVNLISSVSTRLSVTHSLCNHPPLHVVLSCTPFLSTGAGR